MFHISNTQNYITPTEKKIDTQTREWEKNKKFISRENGLNVAQKNHLINYFSITAHRGLGFYYSMY